MRKTKVVQDNEPQILVLKEKYGDNYYIVNNEEELHNICVKVLNERLEDGWYNVDDEVYDDLGFKSEEEIQKLPNGIIKNEVIYIWKKHENYRIEQNKVREFKGRVQNAIKYKFNSEDKINVRNQAYYCLTEREMYEYEKLSLEFPSKI